MWARPDELWASGTGHLPTWRCQHTGSLVSVRLAPGRRFGHHPPGSATAATHQARSGGAGSGWRNLLNKSERIGDTALLYRTHAFYYSCTAFGSNGYAIHRLIFEEGCGPRLPFETLCTP